MNIQYTFGGRPLPFRVLVKDCEEAAYTEKILVAILPTHPTDTKLVNTRPWLAVDPNTGVAHTWKFCRLPWN